MEVQSNAWFSSFSSWLGRETYFGYYVDWSCEALGSFSYNICFIPTGSLFVGMYLYIDGMADDIQATLKQLDQAEAECMWSTYVNEIHFHNEIIEYESFLNSLYVENSIILIILDFITNLFSLAIATNTIISVPLFVNLLTCATVIAFNLLLLEVSDHVDLSIVTSVYNMGAVVTMTINFCLLSELITSALLKIGDVFYDSMWYRLPPRQQKLLGLAIQRGQQVFYLKGLGLIYCSLYTFFQVNLKFNVIFSANNIFLKIRILS